MKFVSRKSCTSAGSLPFLHTRSTSVARSAPVMAHAFKLEDWFFMDSGKMAMPSPFSAMIIAVRASESCLLKGREHIFPVAVG